MRNGCVGLGLALGLDDCVVNRVVVLEGDGALLVNLNSLASIGYHNPSKLLLVVLENGTYASTGGQPTYTSQLDLASMAIATGLTTLVASNSRELKDAIAGLNDLEGPIFLHVKIEPGNSPNIPLLLEDPAVIGAQFGRWIQSKLVGS